MKLSVIIPVFNEINTIKEIIDRVIAAPYEKEIIIVNDCSTDGTGDFLKTIDSENIKVISHSKNMGKGAALKTGFREAKNDIILIQDADLEYDPQEYPLLIEPIEKDIADVVFGSRFRFHAGSNVLFFRHMMGNRALTFLSNLLTDLILTDMETCYKAFRKDIIEKISIEECGFGVEPELTAKIAKLKCRIYEVGITYYSRSYSEGKKITWKDGLWAIWCIVKYNLLV